MALCGRRGPSSNSGQKPTRGAALEPQGSAALRVSRDSILNILITPSREDRGQRDPETGHGAGGGFLSAPSTKDATSSQETAGLNMH